MVQLGEEEQERLRRELKHNRERLHAMDAEAQQRQVAISIATQTHTESSELITLR